MIQIHIGIATVCILILLGVQNIGVVTAAASWFIGLVMPLLLGGVILNTAFGTVTSFVGGIFDFFIALVFAIYILFSKDMSFSEKQRKIGKKLGNKDVGNSG